MRQRQKHREGKRERERIRTNEYNGRGYERMKKEPAALLNKLKPPVCSLETRGLGYTNLSVSCVVQGTHISNHNLQVKSSIDFILVFVLFIAVACLCYAQKSALNC